MSSAATELLFSYGTLLLPHVQLDLFGRHVRADRDVLAGFRVDYLDIADSRVVDLSGVASHPVLRRTDSPHDKVTGAILHISEDELDAADEYEVSLYSRVQVTVASGRRAWVYVG